jgi:hypothetical protein
MKHILKSNKKILLSSLIVIIVLAGCRYMYTHQYIFWQKSEMPFHQTRNACFWIKRTFPKSNISFYEQRCPFYQDARRYHENRDGKILQTRRNDNTPHIFIELFTKNPSEDPQNIVREKWFNKLTPQQQMDCEIQNADMRGSFDDYQMEGPYKTGHKTRYMIETKSEVIESILKKFEGLPDNPLYDYLCGNIVGSTLETYSPYFEFDDRSPDAYLFIQRGWNDEGPPIDLNTIRF